MRWQFIGQFAECCQLVASQAALVAKRDQRKLLLAELDAERAGEALLDGELAPEEAAEVRAHCEACEACRRVRDELAAVAEALRAEAHSLHHLVEAGLLTDKALAEARRELVARERELRAEHATGLELDPVSLLRSVPAFSSAALAAN